MLISPLEVWEKRGEFVKGEKGDFFSSPLKEEEKSLLANEKQLFSVGLSGERMGENDWEESYRTDPVHMFFFHVIYTACQFNIFHYMTNDTLWNVMT